MPLNTLNAELTLALGHKISTTLAGTTGNEYPIDAETKAMLTAQDAALSGAIANSALLFSQGKAATAAKADARDASATTIASIHATLLNDPSVSDDLIVALGLTPRRGGGKPRPAVVTPVAGLVAEAAANGTVALRWDRGGNSRATMFVVESSTDGLGWAAIKTTTRTGYVADGFAPGVAAYFRVTATTSTSASLPSQTVGVYLPSVPASPALRLAA